MGKMYGFTMLPSDWIRDGGLDSFQNPAEAVPELKVLLAMTVLLGEHQLACGKHKVSAFPAPLSRLTEESYLSRTHTSRALQLLLEHGRIEVAAASECSVAIDGRTGVYKFGGDDRRFFPVPYAHLKARRFLKGLRERTAANLAALKVYLVLGAVRNNATGISQVSYDTLEEHYRIPRKLIHRAISTLAGAGMIQMGPARHLTAGGVAAPPNQYKVMGLDRTTNLSAEVWQQESEAAEAAAILES